MPLEISPFKINDLTDHLMLFFTGITRRASDVAKFQIENIKIRQQELFHIKAMAEKASQILIQDKNIEEFGSLLNEAWEYKKKLSDQISNSKIDAIYQRSVLAGAIGGKLIGAGQGGFMLFFVPPNKRNTVKDQLSDLIEIQFTFSRLGSSIITTTI
jgi:D-glycero-alpha-D-manno-heptose-7-phosphate kinase